MQKLSFPNSKINKKKIVVTIEKLEALSGYLCINLTIFTSLDTPTIGGYLRGGREVNIVSSC